jgi:hypothetical protein
VGAGAQTSVFTLLGLKFIGQDRAQAWASKLWGTDRLSRWRVSIPYLQHFDISKKINIMAVTVEKANLKKVFLSGLGGFFEFRIQSERLLQALVI